MPTDIDDLEVASPFGALDADAFLNPAYVHAHGLRDLQRNARRLANRGEYLISQQWRVDGSDDIEAEGGRVFDAPMGWMRVLGPVTAARKRHLRMGEIMVRARITNSTSVIFQVVTLGSGITYRRSATAPNCFEAAGTGSWAWYTMDDITLGADNLDQISVWVTAAPTTAFDTGTFGTPDTGAPTVVSLDVLTDTAAAWNVAAFNARPGLVAVEFLNGDGAVVVQRRQVTALSSVELEFSDPLSMDEMRMANNGGITYRLLLAPGVRLGSVTLREMDDF
jgi:hypothetical protein